MDDSQAPAPRQQESEARKDAILIRKAKLETKLLAQQLTPSFQRREALKVIAGTSGVVIALVTVIGGFLSIGKWFLDQKKVRQIRNEERMERVLGNLAERELGKRMAAVTALRPFLSDNNEPLNTQALLALSGAMALEHSTSILDAMTSLIEDLDPHIVSKTSLDKGLRSFAEVNRNFAQRVNLDNLKSNRYPDANLRETAHAIAQLLRKGARLSDLKGVYLGDSDLSGLDLSGVSFDNATLSWTDFSHSILINATFDHADLRYTNFTSADLRNAKITYRRAKLEEDDPVQKRDKMYYLSGHRSYSSDNLDPPTFRCADLRNSDFEGYSLFMVVSDEFSRATKHHLVFEPDFEQANLAGANLSAIQILIRTRTDDDRSPFRVFSSQGWQNPEFFERRMAIEPGSSLTGDSTAFQESLANVSSAFDGSNWSEARLPQALKDWLTQHPPSDHAVTLLGSQPCSMPR